MKNESNLRNLAREVIRNTESADHRVIAEKVLEKLSDQELRSALAETLPPFISQLMMEHRPRAHDFAGIPAPAPVTFPPPPAPVPNPASQETFGRPAQRRTTAPPAKSAARGFHGGARYRDGWQRTLDSYVKGADGTVKRLKDCTVADVKAIADRLDKQADATAARARGYREIARVMDEHGADVVDALPAEVKMDLLGRAA